MFPNLSFHKLVLALLVAPSVAGKKWKCEKMHSDLINAAIRITAMCDFMFLGNYEAVLTVHL